MSQPLLRVVCLFGLGVVLAGNRDWGLSAWLIGFLTCSLAALGLKRIRPALFPLILIAAGGLNLTCHNRIWSRHDLRHLVTEEPVLADIRGQLMDTPRVTVHVRAGATRASTRAEVSVAMVRFHHQPWEPAAGRVAVSSPGTLDAAFHQGQSVQISGVLAKPDGPRAPGLFDYATYLERRNIYYQLRAGSTHDWSLGEGATPRAPFTDQFVRWARRTLSRGLPEDDPATGLLQAMTLGWKTALTEEIEEPFMKSGTMHVFAVSGLHIALIGGIVLSVLRFCRVPRGICGVLLIPLLWFYTAATGWQASAVRATVMMTIILGGWSLKRPSNLLNSLAAAALLILLLDPAQLFHASFQLSFSVVLSLALILPPLRQTLLRMLESDPLLPVQLTPRWKRWLGTPLRWLLLTAATSFAAWIGSLPLTAEYFHLFSPGTLLANVMLVPCAGAALASALASLATGAWWPWLSEVFNHSAWLWMRCMMQISEGVSELPGAYRYVPAPSPALLFVYYGTLLALALATWTAPKLKWLLTASAVLLASLLLWQFNARHSSVTLTVLPLDGGMALHATAPGHRASTLIDCGNVHAFESATTPFLHACGVNRLRTLLLTHGDVRHVGAAGLVAEQFRPATVGISTVRFRSSAYRRLIDDLEEDVGRSARLGRGNVLEDWEVLHPDSGLKVARADEGVLVLRRTICGTTVLLVSDLDRRGQRLLLEQTDPAQLRAEIVVTGLPGEGEPLIPDLLRQVQPQLIVIGDDERPPSRRASSELLTRLRGGPAEVLNTRKAGAVQILFTAQGWEVVDARGLVLAESGARAPAAQPPEAEKGLRHGGVW